MRTDKQMTNDEIKLALQGQGGKVYASTLAYGEAKSALKLFDANSRVAVKADGVKRTEAETDALVLTAEGRGPLEKALAEAEAALAAVKSDSENLLALASMACAETAAMSRIAGV